MTFRFVRARAASAVCLSVLAAACSNNPQQQSVQVPAASPAGDFFVGQRPVFAHLVNERGGSWVFTTVTASDASTDSGYLVRLNDLTPAFDTRAAECTPQVYPASHRCSPLHPFRDKDTGMLDKIINGSIAVGTAGKVTDISQTYETMFDASAFNQAVDEALVNSGLDTERRRLIALLDAYPPCDARPCVAAAENALSGLRQDIAAHRERLSAMMAPGARIYDVRCDERVHGHYLLTVSCPEQVVATGDEPVEVPIDVTILSRDFEKLYPSFDLADERLRVSIEGRNVTFSNATGEYITLTAKTVYYNSRVNTTSLPIDLPPGISITRNIDEFVSQAIDIASSYRQMTPDKAAGSSFQFGVAVRYRVASEPDEKTLHHVQAFNVGCVIQNHVDPGSCSQPDTRQRAATRPDRTSTPAM